MRSADSRVAQLVAATAAAPLLLLLAPALPPGVDIAPLVVGLLVTIVAYRAGAKSSFLVYAFSGTLAGAVVLSFQHTLDSSLSAALIDSSWIVAAFGIGASLYEGFARVSGSIADRVTELWTREWSALEQRRWTIASAVAPLLLFLPFIGWREVYLSPSYINEECWALLVPLIGLPRGARLGPLAFAASGWVLAAVSLAVQHRLDSPLARAFSDTAFIGALIGAIAPFVPWLRPRSQS